AADHDAPRVHPFPRREEFCAVDAVVDVDNAPIAVQALAIGPAEAGAPAVIDIEHRDAATGPELRGQIERARGRAGGTAVALDQQRRLFLRPADELRIARRIEQAEGR